MVFGRSGQMFPRQRAFHDAIYEEDAYGSERDEDCCQSRGMSAIFCWLLSVIILLGLAASVVLTVFFILKGSPTKNGELELFEESGVNFPKTTEPSISLPNYSQESLSPGNSRDSSSSSEERRRKSGQRPTTRFPPSRRGPHQIYESSEEKGPLTFQNLYPNGKSTSNKRTAILGKANGRNDQTEEESSSSEEGPFAFSTTGRPPVQHVLFTAPPSTTTVSSPRRTLVTSRFSKERTSFTPSTEDTEEDEEDEDLGERTNAHTAMTPVMSSYHDRDRDLTTATSTTTAVTTEKEDDHDHEGEESQLNKMLLDEVPPHKEDETNEDEEFNATEFNLPSSSSKKKDPLARIIKNLAPRWGRNRTVETTTMSSGGNHKYDYTISSREKNATRESSTTPSTGIRRKSAEKVALNSIESPDLSGGGNKRGDEKGAFLDVLVGSEDHKTLITKESEGGIVTSAILPPWYDPQENATILTANNSTIERRKEEKESNESGESESNEHDSSSSAATSVFGGLFNFFNNLPMNNNRHRPPPPDLSSKRIVLKRPGENMLPQGYQKKDKEPEVEDTLSGGATIHTVLPSNIMTTTIMTPGVTEEDIIPANNAFHFGSPDYKTNIYGYYPDEEDDKDNDKTVETHQFMSESISDPNELVNLKEKTETKGKKPSHSIELEINSDATSEIVLEDEEYNPYMMRYGETHAAAGSEVRRTVVRPPPLSSPSPPPLQKKRGSGIRRPTSTLANSNVGESSLSNKDDLEMKGSENRPVLYQRKVPSQMIRQRGAFSNRTGSADAAKTSANKPALEEETPGSAEVADNSNEGGEEHGNGNKSPQPESAMLGSGSAETADNLDVAPKWARPGPVDPLEVGSLEHFTHQGQSGEYQSMEGNVNELGSPGTDSNEKAFPEETGDGEKKEAKKVFKVFPVGYSSSTTERPLLPSSPSISEPEKSGEENHSSGGEGENKSVGFVAPTPVSFHENLYTFSPPPAESIYQSKDGWRPLVYTNSEEEQEQGSAQMTMTSSATAPDSQQQQPPHPNWRERLQEMMRHPVSVRPDLLNNNVPSPIVNVVADNSKDNQKVEDEYYEDEHHPQQSQENRQPQQPEPEVSEPMMNDAHEHEKSQELPPKFSQPDIHQFNSQEGVANLHNIESHITGHDAMQIDHHQQQQQQQHHNNHLHNQNQNHFHNNNNPPNFQRMPVQVHQAPQQPPQQQFQDFQQQMHQIQQQQRQQFHQFSNPNNIIDRSKYMRRPAPPPIMMRRTPIQTLGFVPQSLPIPPRPQLIPQVQAQQFTNANAPPTGFPLPQGEPNLINRKRFKTFGGGRPRSTNSNGNPNWHGQEDGKIDGIAERKDGRRR